MEALEGTDFRINVTLLKTADDVKVRKKVIDEEKSTC